MNCSAESSALDLLAAFDERVSPGAWFGFDVESVLEQSSELRSTTRARLHACRALDQQFADPPAARREAATAREVAADSGDPDVELDALKAMVATHLSPDTLAELSMLAIEYEQLAARSHSVDHVIAALLAQLYQARTTSPGLAVRSLVLRIRNLASTSESPAIRAFCALPDFAAALSASASDELVAAAQSATALAFDSGHDVAIQSAVAATLCADWFTGTQLPERDLASELAESEPWMQAWLAAMLMTQARPGAERKISREFAIATGSDIAQHPRHASWLGQMMMYAELARFCSDPQRGQQVRHLLEPHTDKFGTLGEALDVGSVWFGFAAAVEAEGDHELAARSYERAVDANLNAGAHTWALFAESRSALLAVKLNDGSAAKRVADVRRRAAEVGFMPLVRDLDAALPQTVSALSRRESEVVRCLASGHSNQAIADELFISIKTVERHVANVFVKLGVSSRVDVATWAVSEGLFD